MRTAETAENYQNGVRKVAGEWVPIVMFLGLTVIVSLFFWFRYRARGDLQTTIRTALDKGQELTPELIDRLGGSKPVEHKDLRLALIWLAIAAGMVLIGFSVSFYAIEALYGVLAGAALPFCIGIAYLIMWRYTEREQ
ncbi:MAG: DUF6249 domain-containing protein [Gammaproteobacteria bacterium]|jgi:hypothetical protein|nr:DUF6249 domain-containing protein [Gammaproteobacteria bacterium]MDH3750389.1 DUF6249 domain-containing protein [Gammaproteobacteria bacterium]MDH3805070.1 DUF6249 domain-containing protein [Gammaproteobacteria bacterium]